MNHIPTPQELGEWTPYNSPDPEPGPVLICMADVQPRPVSWLWPNRIPSGRITLLVGRPGEGKSFATMDMAARISTGTPWPDGTDCPRGSVVLIAAEDDPGDTIRPRLDAHYADASRVHILTAVRRKDEGGSYERMVSLADVEAIDETLGRLDDCRLVVVDPIGSFMGSGVDAHRDNEVRAVLAPIAALAERHDVAVLVVAHRRKGTATHADDLAIGSRAFTGIARAVWHLCRDVEQPARRLLLPGKSNLSAEGDGLAFSIIGEPAHISWESAPVTMRADDALAAEAAASRPGPEAKAQNAASVWLRAALADGPRPAKELLEEAREGENIAKRTLERAKADIGAKSYRPETPGPWWWIMQTEDRQHAPQGKELGNLGNLAESPVKVSASQGEDSKAATLLTPGILGDAERVKVTI